MPTRCAPAWVELGGQVTEVAALGRATSRHRRRVEEEHDRALGHERAQPPRRTVLVGQFEVGYRITNVHNPNVAAPDARRPSAEQLRRRRQRRLGDRAHCAHQPGSAPNAAAAVRIGAPLRPGTRVQRRGDAGHGQRGDLVGRGDAGAAVDADVTGRTQLGEAPAQLCAGPERRVIVQVVRGRRADRPRDVTGARVDRLDLAPVARRGPGVEQRFRYEPVARPRRRRRPAGDRSTARRPRPGDGRAAPAGREQLANGRANGPDGPDSVSNPAATHAGRPPSRMRTSAMPAQRSTHQALAAACAPVAS